MKDLVAILRWAENPSDRVAGFRVIQMLDGVGPAFAGRVLDRMAGRDPIDALATYPAPAKVVEQWRDLVALVTDLRSAAASWPAEFDRVRTWYQPFMETRYADAVVRAGDLDQLQRMADAYPSRAKFLTDLTLDPPSATSDEAGKPLRDEDYLILSTIHSAKGQEWKSVYVLNVVDGCIPSDMATGSVAEIEEERRLLYVAMTREGSPVLDAAAQVLRASAGQARRQASVRLADAFHSGSDHAALRGQNLAAAGAGASGRAARNHFAHRRPRRAHAQHVAALRRFSPRA